MKRLKMNSSEEVMSLMMSLKKNLMKRLKTSSSEEVMSLRKILMKNLMGMKLKCYCTN